MKRSGQAWGLEGGGSLGAVFIALLALVWAVVLFPSVFKTRLSSSPIDGVRDFERSMGALASTRKRYQAVSGRWIMVPRADVTAPRSRRSRLIRKRKQAFQRLLVAAGGTFVLGLIPGLHWLLLVHVACDVAVGVYVWKLLQWKRGEGEVLLPEAKATPEFRDERPSAELEFRHPESAQRQQAPEEGPARRSAAQ